MCAETLPNLRRTKIVIITLTKQTLSIKTSLFNKIAEKKILDNQFLEYCHISFISFLFFILIFFFIFHKLPATMPNSGIFDILCNGSGGRLAFGSVILVYIVVYNEVCGPAVVFATLLATIYGLIAATCKSHLRSLQMPYIRASNKFDFACLFLATWMDALAVLTACGALARTLSACLDAMTGGLARIFILGRNSPANEPWPDVLGVAIVFLVTGMFMLGLEHTKAFSFIMSLGMLGLSAVLSAVGWWTGDTTEWQHIVFLPNGISSFLTAAALLTFCYPSDFPMQRIGVQRFIGPILTLAAFLSLILAASCLSTIIHYKTPHEYFAVPIFTILEEKGFQKLTPAAACLLMLTCSGAYLELFPELYGIITRFATSEWKVLAKQISYESSESGNPVLAVFIGGSLCAMMAFACPMQHLSYILAASHITAGFFRAFYLLYTPFRPKYIQQSSSDSSLSYSRLSTAPMVKSASSTSRKRSLWNINLPMQSTVKKPKTKSKNKQEVEKEWLLLGEPSSPCPQREQRDVESTILSDGDAPPSDFEYPEKIENSDSDTSTDIDAIVDEYRQKIKVTTAGPMERTVRVPSVASWRVTIFAILVLGLGIALTVAGQAMRWPPAIFTGGFGVFIIGILLSFIPKYTGSVVSVSPLLCCISLATSVVLFSACAIYSWAAIIFWLIAGLLLLFRCDNWFCSCFNQTTTINEPLIPSVSAKTTTIRMPRPPKGIVTIPTRISGNR